MRKRCTGEKAKGELWKIRARVGELHERRGETEEARRAFSRAAQILKRLV
ncbi:MAG: hypothetical protein AVDCRST_MAG28-4272 [uncultured Rubrobacteraceae bacterium]|uniref:Tetratricopeptide repeat protein n=1 Tax=uncultured Rubrobacteraceae bacterium TaxID=349277 RepID=A0A6J4R987_9ACTN|nr:MAG: hypothetical protein AVDCRST_MAG28-4272 [uncultured Rubrobacteraceae bacterium]